MRVEPRKVRGEVNQSTTIEKGKYPSVITNAMLLGAPKKSFEAANR